MRAVGVQFSQGHASEVIPSNIAHLILQLPPFKKAGGVVYLNTPSSRSSINPISGLFNIFAVR